MVEGITRQSLPVVRAARVLKMKRCSIPIVVLLGACTRALPPAASEEPLVVAVISDLNSGYGSTAYDAEVSNAVAQIREWRPHLVLIAGDMIAGQRPTLTDENVRAMWSAFDSVVAAPLRAAGIPFAFTLGNHDASGHPAHERDRRLAAEHWSDPVHTPPLQYIDRGAFPRYYAFLIRNVFFVSLDASTGNVHSDSAQMSWLRATLASPQARNADMRVVLGHVPLYAVAEGRNLRGEVQGEPDSLRALLEAGDVRMHVSGHHHAYYPGRRGEIELLHAGAAGSGPRPLIGSTLTPYKSITLLRMFATRDSIEDRTWRMEGDRMFAVDPASLPARIDGINGFVLRSR
jgi:hypothetical protein